MRSRRTTTMKQQVEAALQREGFPPNKIAEAASSFDPSMSVSHYWSSKTASTLIQARAFSSYKAVMAAAEEIKNNEEFARAKKLCIPVNAPYILSLVKSNDALLQDTVRDQYIERVKQFVNSSKGKKTTEESILTDIRGNCNLTASLFLQSCRKPKTLSLLALSHKSDDDCQKREVSQKELEKLIKICKTTKKPIDLVHNELNHQILYNCFICPSSCETSQAQQIQAKLPEQLRPTFVDEILSHYNALKVIFISHLNTLTCKVKKNSVHTATWQTLQPFC